MKYLWLLVFLVACQAKKPPAPPACAKLSVVVRDGQGVLVESMASDGTRCDPAGAPRPILLTAARQPDGTVDISDAKGPRLRIYSDDTQLRVLHLDGVPFGDVGKDTIHDKAGVPVANLERDGERVLVRGLDGAVRFAVTGATPRAAGLLAIPDLSDEERHSLFLLWCR
jgi:hypothetical protein